MCKWTQNKVNTWYDLTSIERLVIVDAKILTVSYYQMSSICRSSSNHDISHITILSLMYGVKDKEIDNYAIS